MEYCRIGLIGSGFVASGLARLLMRTAPDLPLTAVLSRRSLSELALHLQPFYVAAANWEHFLQQVDLVVECSGDILHATDMIHQALAAEKPVLTMHSEWHVTVGSAFVGRGVLSEAEGDQPGSLAALAEDMRMMGFEPWVYGNIKQYLNHYPTPVDMQAWSQRQGIRKQQTTSFTDGTKLQHEQALVANGLGAHILKSGLLGPATDDLQKSACMLAEKAFSKGQPIADYLLSTRLPPGVFITARHSREDQGALAYLKLGEGPWYTLYRPYHLCQYEMVKTIRRLIQGQGVLLNNSSQPRVGVRALAKRNLQPGDQIEQAIGSFDIRGEAVTLAEDPNHLPIGIIQSAKMIRPVMRDQPLSWQDVELPESRALTLTQTLYQSK